MAEYASTMTVRSTDLRELSIGILPVDPAADTGELHTLSRQVAYFMGTIQRELYMAPPEEGGLGLTPLDPEVPCNPDRYIETSDRVERFRQATGLNTENGRAIWYAVQLDPLTDEPRRELGALAGLLILSRYSPIKRPDKWQPPYVRIDEWDVRKDVRRRHVGATLLRTGLTGVDRNTQLVLDVAEGNADAIATYQHLNFELNGGRTRHGVFDTAHVQMTAPRRRVLRVIGQTADS